MLGDVRAYPPAEGAGLRLPSGEFVDLPVARRAHCLLELANAVEEPKAT